MFNKNALQISTREQNELIVKIYSEIKNINRVQASLSEQTLERLQYYIEAQQNSIKKAILEFFILGFIALVLYIVLGLILSIRISNPIIKLKNAASEIYKGNFNTEAEIESNDEIGDLADVFNKMTAQIQKSMNDLKESEEKYRTILENIKDVYFRTDMKGNVLLISPSGVKMFGYDTMEEAMNLNIARDIYQNPEERDVFLRKLVADGAVINYETTLKRKDGTLLIGETNSRLIYNDAHEPIAVEGLLRDITQRIKAEEERKKLETQLLQAHKMEAIGTLSGGIAHDFNNILSPIMIHSEMAMMDLPPDSSVQFNLKEIFKAGERARDMVRQILTFSRKKNPEKMAIKMGSVLKEATRLLRSSIPTVIEIRHDIETEADTIFADSTQIHQVIFNLCTNASHAMREKGGVLKIELDDLYLDSSAIRQFTCLNPGSYLRLTVSDTGDGIDPENIDKIFEPYFTTKDIGEGTGMGLAATHGIVKSHGGDIVCESAPGKGTTFRVLFPKFEGEITQDPEDIVRFQPGTERILFVDDEKTAVDAFQSMLGNLGYKVTARTSSVEALKAFQNNPESFDLIITDMTMPNMTGKELAKELMSIRQDIPIILCTGFSDQMDAKRAEEMGIRAFVMKPILMREIANTIRDVLDKK